VEGGRPEVNVMSVAGAPREFVRPMSEMRPCLLLQM
jgi:hypothetical protein